MKKNNAFFQSLYYDWYKYLLIFLPIISVLVISNQKSKIQYSEELRIFNYKDPDDKSFLSDLTNKYGSRGILNSMIQPYTISYPNFDDYLEVSGYEYSDLIILPESKMLQDPNYYSSKSLHFGNDNTNQYYSTLISKNPNLEFVNYNDSPFGYFGIKIYIKDNNEYNSKNKINNYYTFEETSIISISKQSNKITNNIAFEALNDLL